MLLITQFNSLLMDCAAIGSFNCSGKTFPGISFHFQVIGKWLVLLKFQ